jgi:ZIP family zinc transporter
MMSTLYALIPFALALLGALLAAVYKPTRSQLSILQHFVAGVVIAAVAVELLPKILGKPHSTPSIAFGFVIGLAFMVTLHELAHLLSHQKKKERLPLRMIGAIGIDLLADGVLIGLSFIAGVQSSLIIALSLSPCAFFLSLTMATTLRQKNISKPLILTFALLVALMLPIGAFIGSNVVERLPQNFITGTIAASIAALLYLGIEEFLVEAHANKEDHYTPLSFFFGFLLVLLISL